MKTIKALYVVALSVLVGGCGITSGDEFELLSAAGSAGSAGASTAGSAGTAQGGSAGVSATKCVQGQQIVCACIGALGIKVCNAQGAFDACKCDQPDAGTSGAGGSVGGSSGSGGTSTGGTAGTSQGGSSGTGGASTGGSAGTSTGGTGGSGQPSTGGSSGSGGSSQICTPGSQADCSPLCGQNQVGIKVCDYSGTHYNTCMCFDKPDSGVGGASTGGSAGTSQGGSSGAGGTSTGGSAGTSTGGSSGTGGTSVGGSAGTGGACQTQRWYVDADSDGHGNPSIHYDWCIGSDTLGYVLIGNDCNDNDASVHPGAIEMCNLKDDNCDGEVDEGYTKFIYRQDLDGDGYGSNVTITACMPSAGYVIKGIDCNDNDASVHPGTVEICGDGKDNDCNGQIEEGCTTPSATKLVCFFREGDVAKHDYYAINWIVSSTPVVTANSVWGRFEMVNPKEGTKLVFDTYRDPPSWNQWEYAGCQWNNPTHLNFEFACYLEKNGVKLPTVEVQSESNGQNGCRETLMIQASGAADWDSDGFSLPHDCNDNNADIHPGAVDLIGGADMNCNGASDF